VCTTDFTPTFDCYGKTGEVDIMMHGVSFELLSRTLYHGANVPIDFCTLITVLILIIIIVQMGGALESSNQVESYVSTKICAENESPSRYIDLLSGLTFSEMKKFELIRATAVTVAGIRKCDFSIIDTSSTLEVFALQ
jgi:hypothetical protein